MAELNEKAGEEKPDIRRSPEYRRFKKLLRKVVKAPPMPKRKEA
jgi:hypothetical protein